jgi:predicted metal-dependent hydrolase
MIPTAQEDVKIIRRPIKHARLRVREDTSVELLVPDDFLDDEIDAILRKKEPWIQRHRAFFRSHPRRLNKFVNGEVLLFGQRFCILSDDSPSTDVVVDESKQLVRSHNDLADPLQKERTREKYRNRESE